MTIDGLSEALGLTVPWQLQLGRDLELHQLQLVCLKMLLLGSPGYKDIVDVEGERERERDVS